MEDIKKLFSYWFDTVEIGVPNFPGPGRLVVHTTKIIDGHTYECANSITVSQAQDLIPLQIEHILHSQIKEYCKIIKENDKPPTWKDKVDAVNLD